MPKLYSNARNESPCSDNYEMLCVSLLLWGEIIYLRHICECIGLPSTPSPPAGLGLPSDRLRFFSVSLYYLLDRVNVGVRSENSNSLPSLVFVVFSCSSA